MSTPRQILDALTMGGTDSAIDVLLKSCMIVIAGAVFVTGCVLLLAEAMQ